MCFAASNRSRFAIGRRARSVRGLTLIELVVVIAILAVLGGLAVQTFPSLMKRTHLSKCADTIAALNRIWGESFAMNTRYPNRCDSLLAAGGTDLYERLTPGLTAIASPTALSDQEATALASIGLTSVVDLAPGAVDATFDSAPLGTTPRSLTSGANVVQLQLPTTSTGGASAAMLWSSNPLGLKRHLDAPAGASVKYVAFGIGPNCTGVGAGKLLQEAPTHYGADDTINPAKVYQRYLVVYALTTRADGTVTATFEAAAGNDVSGPSSSEGHVRQFYAEQSSEAG